jgi:hypothetical protein
VAQGCYTNGHSLAVRRVDALAARRAGDDHACKCTSNPTSTICNWYRHELAIASACDTCLCPAWLQACQHPQSMPPQRHQMPQSMPRHPMHRYGHQRTDSGSSVGVRRRRNSSFRLRRADPQSWVNIPPQLGQPLPQIQLQSEKDLISGARTTAVPGIQSIIKREGEVPSYMEAYH